MRSKVTVVLLFLNVVLFCYIFYFEQRWQEERKLLEARRRVLPTEIASMDSLTRTSARNPGETVRVEKRPDGSWWLTAPYEWPANPNAVSRIHNELQFLEHYTSFAVADLAKGGQTLADYGLADPDLTLEFTAAQKSFKLLIGADTKIDNRLYVLSPDGARVHVVSRSLADSAGLPLGELRADTLFTIPVFEVRSLNIQTAAPSNLKVRLRRDAAARWNFESPILARAAKSAVEVAINALNALNAVKFLEPRDTDLDRAGLNTPALRVTLEGNARRETLLLGHPVTAPVDGAKPGASTEYYAKIEDKAVVFTTAVPAPLLEVLRSSQETLRDARVADFEPATVSSLTIAAPGQPELSLQKLEPTPAVAGEATPAAAPAGDGWQVVVRTTGQAPVPSAADPGLVAGLLQKIHLLSARKFLSDAPAAADLEGYGFNNAERTITLNLSTGGGPRGNEPSTLVLQIGVSPDKPGEAFARVTNFPFIYSILPDILEDTPSVALHYRQRLLRELPEGAILTSVALVDLTTDKPIFVQSLLPGNNSWDAALTQQPEWGRKSIAGILAQLRVLRAQRFTAETFSSDHADTPQGPRPWRYRLDYTIAFNGGAQSTPASLLLTERLGGQTQLAGTADFGGVVFNLTQELIDALHPLTYTAPHDPGPVPPATTPATTPEEPVPATSTPSAPVAAPVEPAVKS